MLAMRPHTKSWCSTNRSGPGCRPQMKRPAMMTAEVGEPGTPRAIIGTSEPTAAESAAACGAMIPEISPFPKSSLFFAHWRARP